MNEWVWSNGGMVLTGENWSAGRKTLYSVGGRWMNEYGAMVECYWQRKTKVLGEKPVPVPFCPPQTPNGTGLELNPGLRSDRPATDRLSHGRAWYQYWRTTMFGLLDHVHTPLQATKGNLVSRIRSKHHKKQASPHRRLRSVQKQ